VIRVKTLDDAIDLVNSSKFGNTTSIFTSDGKSARDYARASNAAWSASTSVVAAPMAFFPFSGWKNAFLAIYTPMERRVAFYTEQKVIMTRWF